MLKDMLLIKTTRDTGVTVCVRCSLAKDCSKWDLVEIRYCNAILIQ